MPHRFGNSSDRPAQMLPTYAPAGSGPPPPFLPNREQVRRAVEAVSRYGVRFVT